MDRQVSNNATEINVEHVASILEGKLDDLPPISSRVVRVFISSTFSDMVQERNAIMEHVYPSLKEFCRDKYGLEFQIMDLRWGIQEEAEDDHTTIDFCIREIENCKNSSIGPSFVALLGQKYGYRTFPPNIPKAEFEALRDALIQHGEDISLLDAWFCQDENAIPPVYNLLPISSVLKNYNSRDADLKAAERAQWQEVFQQMQSLLRQAVGLCVEKAMLEEREKDKYFISVTEYEIIHGMLESSCSRKNSICLSRTISNLEDNLHKHQAKVFLDIHPATREVDLEAQQLLKNLKDHKVPKALSDEDTGNHFTLEWSEECEDPTSEQDYIDKFCSVLRDRLTCSITKAMSEIENLVSDSFVIETLQHLYLCKQRCEMFHSREPTLAKIRRYIMQPAERPLVLFGVSGSGKTSVMAKVASQVSSWLPGQKPVMLLRFLGTTARSSSIRLALGSICWQIAVNYQRDINDIPGDYAGLVLHFQMLLKAATSERPLVILLDSLDQLSNNHRAHNLVWLPPKLPPHVHMIVSTLPAEYGLLNMLRDILPEKENFLEILPLGEKTSFDILEKWMEQANRRLTRAQTEVVCEALKQCTLPLYTRLIFREVTQWKSYWSPQKTVLAHTVKGIINRLFDRVEQHYGKILVSHALAYLTASRNGLSEAEIQDLLSLDDTVLNNVFVHWLPPIRRIPPLLWPRIFNELSSYIVEREANGMIVVYWYHRLFSITANERYLHNGEFKRFVHSSIADYFLGVWGGGRKKPFMCTVTQMKQLGLTQRQSEADRKVPSQPLIFGQQETCPRKLRYNLRKLHELPYHLIFSNRVDDLKKKLFFNYTWLHTKLEAMSLQDVISDFRWVINAGIEDPEIRFVADTLRVGGSFVNQNPDTLAFDITARLLPYYDVHKSIRHLIQQCDTEVKHSALVPLLQCFEAPRQHLLYSLEDHRKPIIDLLFSNSTDELVSVAMDGTIGYWDLSSGERTKIIDVSEISPGPRSKLLQSMDGKYLICDSDTPDAPVYIIDMKTGQILWKVGARKAGAQRRAIAMYTLLCRQNFIIDMMTGKVLKRLEDFMKITVFVTVALTYDERLILIGEYHNTHVFHIDSCTRLISLPANNIPSRIVITQDNHRALIGYSVDCLFKIFDIDPNSIDTFGSVLFEYNYQKAFPNVKFIEGYQYGRELAEITVSQTDPNLLLLNLKRCYLIMLDTNTGESMLMDYGPLDLSSSTYLHFSSLTHDNHFVIAAENHFLYVWDALSGNLLRILTLHTMAKYPLAVSPTRNLVATASNVETKMKLWDLDKLQEEDCALVPVYENPIDVMAAGPEKRLLFIESYYPLNSSRGYKNIGSFGIDIWNLNTGKRSHFLPFDKYGRLMQMETSADCHYLGLLLDNRARRYICVIDTEENIISAFISHNGCYRFTVSGDWSLLATVSKEEKTITKIWDIDTEQELLVLGDCHSPLFSLDGQSLLSIMADNVIVGVKFPSMEKLFSLRDRVDRMQVMPTRPDHILLTKFPRAVNPQTAVITLWDFQKNKDLWRLEDVAPGGIQDISRQGKYGIDGYLRVYDMQEGCLLRQLIEGPVLLSEERKFIHLTYDGFYAIWIDNDLTIKVCSIFKDGKLVANTSTHEKPVSLRSFDFGYLLVVGCEDGRILTMKLEDESSTKATQPDPLNSQERLDGILSRNACCQIDVEQFDEALQVRPEKVMDENLPYASERIQSRLKRKARVPHSIISSDSCSKLETFFVGDDSLYNQSIFESSASDISTDSTSIGASSVSSRESPTRRLRSFSEALLPVSRRGSTVTSFESAV